MARRGAAVAPSWFRQAEGRRLAAPLESAWWQGLPAAAWRQPAVAAAQVMASPSEMKAAAVAEAVRPVASAPQARLPAEGVAAASGVKVQPQEAAEAEPGAKVPPQEAAEVEPAASAQQPGAAAASGAVEVLPPEVAGVALDAVAEPQQAVVAAEPDAVAAQRPGVVAPSARQPAAGHPSAARPSWRPGGHLPWLAPRRAARTAHAMRRSRTASPSKRSWRAAGCEDLS